MYTAWKRGELGRRGGDGITVYKYHQSNNIKEGRKISQSRKMAGRGRLASKGEEGTYTPYARK